MTKWIIAVGVLIIVGVGLWWSGVISNFMPKASTPAPQATSTPETTQQPVSDLPTSSTDASDSAMAQDSAAIDAQMQSLTSDSANIDSSMNDKAVTQEF